MADHQPPAPAVRSRRPCRPRPPPQVNEQLAGERSSLAQVLRQEFADRLAASEEENRQVRAELAELRARQRLELEQLTREKQAELEEVHGRWAAGLSGVLGSTGLGEAGGTLWLQRGRWAQEGEQAAGPASCFLLPASCLLPMQNWAASAVAAPGSVFEALSSSMWCFAPEPGKKPSQPQPGRVPYVWVSGEELPGP